MAPGSTLPRRAAALVLLLGTTCALLLGGASRAAAHAVLTGTDPANGAVVQTAPERVTLRFSESVTVSADSVQVLNPEAEDVTGGAPRHAQGSSTAVQVPLGSGLPDGTYVVAWKVVSADSHPIRGAFSFSVGAPSKTTVEVDQLPSGNGTVGGLYDLARYFAYGGLALLVGAAAFVLHCWPQGGERRPVQRLLLAGWSTLLLSTLALLVLRGPYEDRGGGGFGAAFDLSVLQETLDTKPGAALAVRLLMLAAAGAFLAVLVGQPARQRHPEVRIALYAAGLLLAAGLASTWSVMEHPSVGIQSRVAVPVDVVHLVAVGTWLGGLAALLTALYLPAGKPIGAVAVERFSTVAFCSVLALVGTGTYQAWRQVGTLDALVSTDFGRLLLVKLAGVLLLLGAAGFSRRWVRRLRAAPAGTTPDGTTGADAQPPVGSPAEAVTAGSTREGARTSGDVAPSGEDVPAPTSGGRSGNPARAAQLARQRAAVAAARARRERHADPHRGNLRRSVLVEVCVAVVVLAVTTFLTSTEPGRAAETPRAGTASAAPAGGPAVVELPYDTGGTAGKGTAEITVDPARSGDNVLHVRLTNPVGAPVEAPEVRVSFTLESRDVGPLGTDLSYIAPGHWVASDAQLPLPGRWTVSVTVRTSDIDQVTVSERIRIG